MQDIKNAKNGTKSRKGIYELSLCTFQTLSHSFSVCVSLSLFHPFSLSHSQTDVYFIRSILRHVITAYIMLRRPAE